MSTSFRNIAVGDILLDFDNPRIKHYLELYTDDEITAEQVALALSNNSNNSGDSGTSYKSLRDSIWKCQGIVHPIIVSHEADGRYIAIEGNTRLQIYKDFLKSDKSGLWDKIPAIVFEQISKEKKHEIRLQSHLVGPRAWDPYSKAKYLWQLSEVEHMPLTTIISLCGGGKSEILKSIEAFKFMEAEYRPYVRRKNMQFEVKEFSKFYEYQNSTIKHSVEIAGFDVKIFAQWVADGNVDTAQRVRIIPKVMGNKEAKEKFLRTNLAEAEKVLNAAELESADLSKYPYYVLAAQLFKKLVSGDPSIAEIKKLAHGDSEEALERLYHIQSLQGQLQIITESINQIANG